MSFEPMEVLIQVCHFNTSTNSCFGTPILVKIKNGETVAAVRNRIRETLDVPEKVNVLNFRTFNPAIPFLDAKRPPPINLS